MNRTERKIAISVASIAVFLAYGSFIVYYNRLAVPKTDTVQNLNFDSHLINPTILADSSISINIDDDINININSDKTIEESDNGNDNDNDNRPWMVVHIGPPKTGTTTIQEGLRREDVALRLARDDNVYYMGIVLYSVTRYNQTAHYNTHKNHSNYVSYPNVTMFRIREMNPNSLSQEFRDELERHRKNNRNVVVSSEHWTSKLENRKKYWDDWFKNFFLDSSLQNVNGKRKRKRNRNQEPFFGFRVKVVVTYRHFFQWLPSSWGSQYLLPPKSGPPPNSGIAKSSLTQLHPYPAYVPGIIEYVEWFLHNLAESTTDPNNITYRSYASYYVRPGLINVDVQKVLPTSHASVWSFLQWTSQLELYDRVDVFDMHQQPLVLSSSKSNQDNDTSANASANASTSIPTRKNQNNLLADFVCQMLPTATHTCRYLHDPTTNNNFTKRVAVDKSTWTSHDIDRVVQAADQKGRAIKGYPKFYELKRPRSVKKWFRDQSRLYNTTDHLTRCLAPETLETLRRVSWEFLWLQTRLVRKHNSERKRANASADRKDNNRRKSSSSSSSRPGLFQSSRPTGHLLLSSQRVHHHQQQQDEDDDDNDDDNDNDESSLMAFTKAMHDASFQESVAKGLFCEIDIERLFQNQDFLKRVLVSLPKDTNTINW